VGQADFRHIFAYGLSSGAAETGRSLLIAACLVAAIRLRGAPIQPSPKLSYIVSESVQLAKMILRELGKE
jgi:hypothetical protein